MPKTFRKILGLTAAFLGFFLCGCSSMRPIASPPPVSAITVTAPFTVPVALKSAAFPAGEYHALYEDDGGFYYQAPTKIVERGIFFNHFCDGGLYVKRGSKEAKKWYVIEDAGETFFGPFNAALAQRPEQ